MASKRDIQDDSESSTSWDQFLKETFQMDGSSSSDGRGSATSTSTSSEEPAGGRRRGAASLASRSFNFGRRRKSGSSPLGGSNSFNFGRRNRSDSINETLTKAVMTPKRSKSKNAAWKANNRSNDKSLETMRGKLLRQKREGARLGRISSKGKFVPATSLTA